MAALLKGTNVALFNPKGIIAAEQHKLMLGAVMLMLVIAIPTMIAFYYTAWKYRDSNKKVVNTSHAHHNKITVFGIWALPIITLVFLVSIMWPAAHRLAPQKSLESDKKPLTIQVVALRWKWLFIYPEQQIATVNFIQIPVDTPVQFDISADEMPMSSFWIPQLAGQLYSMTGHVNRLNIMAETPGDYAGSSAEINGTGFAGMKFTTRASSVDDFDTWVQKTKTSSYMLDSTEYKKLLVPSEYNKAAFFSQAGPEIYDTMIAKYEGERGQEHMEHE